MGGAASTLPMQQRQLFATLGAQQRQPEGEAATLRTGGTYTDGREQAVALPAGQDVRKLKVTEDNTHTQVRVVIGAQAHKVWVPSSSLAGGTPSPLPPGPQPTPSPPPSGAPAAP